jgi:hypothetical protein
MRTFAKRIFPNVLRAKLVWRPAKMFGESGDTADVCGYCGRCIVADLEIFQHPLS